MKLHRKSSFTLIEICIAMSILVMLTSTFAFIGYDALKEFRRRSALSAFTDYLYELRNKNTSSEYNLLLMIEQRGNTIYTTLDGNTQFLTLGPKKRKFYIPELLKENTPYTLTISPASIPRSQDKLATWIISEDCGKAFYK